MAVKYEMVHGKKACDCQAKTLGMIESRLRKIGAIKKDLSGLIMQGAYNGSAVSASAGSHAGGGVWDVKYTLVNSVEKRRAWRESGAWATHRKFRKGVWPEHGHVVWVGCPHLSGVAARQVVQFGNGTDGLASAGRDDEPRFKPISWEDALAEFEKPKAVSKPAAVVKKPAVVTLDASDVAVVARSHVAKSRVSGWAKRVAPDARVRVVQAALNAKRSKKVAVDGLFGPSTRGAYAEWQKVCGYRGSAADGVPGFESLSKLAKATARFKVKR